MKEMVEVKIKKAITIASMLLMAFILTIASNAPLAKAQTGLQMITLPEGVPTPWQMQYDVDGARYIWYSGWKVDPLLGYVVRIDTWNFVADPNGSVVWWPVTPQYNPEGSAYAVDVGLAIGGGYIWSGGAYSGPDTASDILVRFNPVTNETTTYWLTGVRNLRTIRCDGVDVWLAGVKIPNGGSELNGAIIKFDIASGTYNVYWIGTTASPYDIIMDDDFIWFSYNGIFGSGIGRMSKTGETVTYYPTSSNIVFLAKATDGKIWYSSNLANNIGSLDPTTGIITEYPIGIPPENPDNDYLPYDSPYGLTFDALGNLWIAGYDYYKVIEFDPSTGDVISTTNTTNKPYYPIPVGNTIWCWGQGGSVDMNILGASMSWGRISAPIDPVQVGTSIQANVTFAKSVGTAIWDWGDGSTSDGSIDKQTITGCSIVYGTHAYSAPGVYTLKVTIDGGTSSQFMYVVVYDPTAGYVTGVGWVSSPQGAYMPDPSLSGRSIFGFVAKYRRGASTPTGITEFIIHMDTFTFVVFRSTSYEWLVISGPKAQLKGAGTINREGNYGFMLTAIDGKQSGGGGLDKLRIKIWDAGTGSLIYDNQKGSPDDADPTTVIGGGNIIIHKV